MIINIIVANTYQELTTMSTTLATSHVTSHLVHLVLLTDTRDSNHVLQLTCKETEVDRDINNVLKLTKLEKRRHQNGYMQISTLPFLVWSLSEYANKMYWELPEYCCVQDMYIYAKQIPTN